MRAAPPRRRLPWAALLSLCLAASLLLTQTLGLVHGLAHGNHPETLTAHHAPAGYDKHHAAHKTSAHGWLQGLFTGHGNQVDCRLYDQASCGSAAPLAWQSSLPVLVPTVVAARVLIGLLPRCAAVFEARGPPF